MKTTGLIMLASLLLLGYNACKQLKTPAEDTTVYLCEGFHGTVSVWADNELIFSGHVNSNDAIQCAATLPLHIHGSAFILRMEAQNQARESSTGLIEQKIDCDRGRYICVFFKTNEKLVVTQERHKPDFY